MSTEIENIAKKLDLIKSELDYIKENMVEKDDVMNLEEFAAYKRSFKKENLISLKDVEKELGF